MSIKQYTDIRQALSERGITGDGAYLIIETAELQNEIENLREELNLEGDGS